MNYDELLSQKIKRLKPSGIRKFFDIVAEMPDAISLGVGEPDFVTPWSIRDAAIKSIQKGYTQYTSNRGLPKLRVKVAEYLESRFSLSYDPSNEILITVGASEAIDLALRAIINDGDEILVPEPSYVSYAPLVTVAGGEAIGVPTDVADEFRLTPDAIESRITPRTKALILPYPNNPTGAVMTKANLESIIPIIIKHNLLIISDEIYAELTYGARHISVATLSGMRERTVVINGFSKSFAMTGWRLGYVAAPAELTAPMIKLHQYAIMCAPTFSQYAALEALSRGLEDNFATVAEMRDEYDMRRRYLLKAFDGLGLEVFEPRGAFYIFPRVESLGFSGEEFAQKLLYSQRVAVVPGSAFGDSCGGFVRCCYASSMKNLREAVKRITAFVEQNGGKSHNTHD